VQSVQRPDLPTELRWFLALVILEAKIIGIGFLRQRSFNWLLQSAPAALRYGYNEVYVHGRNSR
jgi:hypothetical protein